MAQLDLGRITLQIRDSQLQLHLSAKVHLSRLQRIDDLRSQGDISQGVDLDESWVTEAPYMELRFFICSDWALKGAVDRLVTGLGDKLCQLRIWSELGFTATVGTQGDEEPNTPGVPYLRIGLQRQPRRHNPKRRWTLPIAMANPPDVYPPGDILTANLASIDVFLDFCHFNENLSSTHSFYDYEHGLCDTGLTNDGLPSSFETTTAAGASSSIYEDLWPGNIHTETLPQSLETETTHRLANEPRSCHEQLFRLLEFGMQRLIISNTIKDPNFRISEDTTLGSLPDLAPAVFKVGHQEAINQRGVTIPIITKSIITLLKGGRTASFEERIMNDVHTSPLSAIQTPERSVQATGLKSEIHSRLWHIAQAAITNSTPLKRSSLILPTIPLDEQIDALENTTQDYPLSQDQLGRRTSGTSTDSQPQPSDEDALEFAALLNDSDSGSESGNQLLDNYSDASFTDIGESTQSSLDTLFSAAFSSQTAWSEDENMLLSETAADHGVIKSGSGDMEAYDADIMMIDGI